MKDMVIDYVNYRGERSTRRIRPLRMEVMETEWHPGEQLILVAIDLDKGENGEERHFCVADIGRNRPLTDIREG